MNEPHDYKKLLQVVSLIAADDKPIRRISMLGGPMSTGAEAQCDWCGYNSDGYQGAGRQEHHELCVWVLSRLALGQSAPHSEEASRLKRIAELESELGTTPSAKDCHETLMQVTGGSHIGLAQEARFRGCHVTGTS